MGEVRRVVALALPRTQALDLAGPIDVFASATERVSPGYAGELVTPGGGHVRCANGLRIAAEPLPEPAPMDTLLVLGGEDMPATAQDAALREWVLASAARARRTVS